MSGKEDKCNNTNKTKIPMWHPAWDMWRVTSGMWHVTHGGRWKFSHNFRSLVNMVLELLCLEEWGEKDELLSYWVNKWRRCLQNSPIYTKYFQNNRIKKRNKFFLSSWKNLMCVLKLCNQLRIVKGRQPFIPLAWLVLLLLSHCYLLQFCYLLFWAD